MKSIDELIKEGTTKIKIFNSGSKRIDLLEKDINKWLQSNPNIEIVNILTTSNVAAYGGNDPYYHEEFYLIVIFKN